jgi:3D-(3,5/4)-trihydroxycyclohexane-1,2-dione acylhydrolase (decyclizing)
MAACRFGTWYRYRDATTGKFDGERLPVDLAGNAASLGADVVHAATVADLRRALAEAKKSDVTTVIHVETDPLVPAPASGVWWDVPVAEVAETSGTPAAGQAYRHAKAAQRIHL